MNFTFVDSGAIAPVEAVSQVSDAGALIIGPTRSPVPTTFTLPAANVVGHGRIDVQVGMIPLSPATTVVVTADQNGTTVGTTTLTNDSPAAQFGIWTNP